MADLIMPNGIRVTSEVRYLKTGEVKPFDPSMQKDIFRSVLCQTPAHEFDEMELAPPGRAAEFKVIIHSDGRTVVRDA